MINTTNYNMVPKVSPFNNNTYIKNYIPISSLDISQSSIPLSPDLLKFTIDNNLDNLNSDDITQIYNNNTIKPICNDIIYIDNCMYQ